MGTMAIAYKEKYFWIHNATGEVFAAILLEELKNIPIKWWRYEQKLKNCCLIGLSVS